jgi:hypothetical protein
LGRISGYFQYPVYGRISGKSNPVSGLIPDIKKGRIYPAGYPVHPYFEVNSQ